PFSLSLDTLASAPGTHKNCELIFGKPSTPVVPSYTEESFQSVCLSRFFSSSPASSRTCFLTNSAEMLTHLSVRQNDARATVVVGEFVFQRRVSHA
ncbi:unnamed protein product, partial [Ixodes persulcatus]